LRGVIESVLQDALQIVWRNALSEVF